MISPAKTANGLTDSDSRSGNLGETQEQGGVSGGLGESALIFSQPSLGPLLTTSVAGGRDAYHTFW